MILLFMLVGALLFGGGFACGWHLRPREDAPEIVVRPPRRARWNPGDTLNPIEFEPVTPAIQRAARSKQP